MDGLMKGEKRSRTDRNTNLFQCIKKFDGIYLLTDFKCKRICTIKYACIQINLNLPFHLLEIPQPLTKKSAFVI